MTEKEQNRNPTASPKEGKPETPLTEEQRQRRRKMLVYPLMGLLFIGLHVAVFAPSGKDKAEAQQGVGFNTEMPMPAQSGIIADKRTAYEQARLEEKQKERRTQMNDLAALFSDKEDEAETQTEDFDLLNPTPQQPARTYGGGSPRQPIRSSAAAYEDINRTLGTFYETPKDDPEKEELRERIEELEAMMVRQAEPSGSTLDDQVALLEKSYELAAKYMPAGQGGTAQQPTAADKEEEDKKTVRNGKAVAQPVRAGRGACCIHAWATDDRQRVHNGADRRTQFRIPYGHRKRGSSRAEHHSGVRTRQPDHHRRAGRPPAAHGTDAGSRSAHTAQHGRRGCGTGCKANGSVSTSPRWSIAGRSYPSS